MHDTKSRNIDQTPSAQSVVPAPDRPDVSASAMARRRSQAMIEFPIKLAVASKEGLAISEHFGHAKQFRIYELGPDSCELLGIRQVSHYCLGQHSDQSAMAGILETIKDCQAVFVAKIGEGPTEKLQAIGVRSVSTYAYEAIEESLRDYVRRSVAGEEVS